MIGLDRPIRPEWIYNILKIITVGESPVNYYQNFEKIAKELIGKEGKRKVRTIIFRSFIYTLQKGSAFINHNPFLQWVHQSSLKDMKPLFLLKLITDYEICRFVIKKISLNIQPDDSIHIPILMKKTIQEYGDRDVVKRSLRSFLKTLEYFGFADKLLSDSIKIKLQIKLTDGQLRKFLLLYGNFYLNSKSIDLNSIEQEFLFFFNNPHFLTIARKYHGKDWEYIRDIGRNIVYLK